MSEAAVKAGEAYVALTTRRGDLNRGLNTALSDVRKWAQQAGAAAAFAGGLGAAAFGAFTASTSALGVQWRMTSAAIDDGKKSLSGTLTQALEPLDRTLGVIVVRTSDWIRQNSQLVGSIGIVGAAVGSIGFAFATLIKGIAILATPGGLAFAAFGVLAAGALLVTDALGETNSGMLDLFNSVRINGRGLGTILGEEAIRFETAWVNAADAVIDKFLELGRAATRFLGAPEWVKNLLTAATIAKNITDAVTPGDAGGLAGRVAERNQRAADRISALNAADPQDPNAPTLSFDGARARDGLNKLANWITSGFGTPAGTPDVGATVAPVIDRLTSTTTLSGAVASQLGIGGTLDERTAKAAEKTADNTAAILRTLRQTADESGKFV